MAQDNYFRDDDFWAALCIKTSTARGNDEFMFRGVITGHILTSLKEYPTPRTA